LLARQAEIGRYWFGEVNPLDRFVLARLDYAGGSTNGTIAVADFTLEFDDLAVTSGLESADLSRYQWAVYHGDTRLVGGVADAPTVPVPALPDAARASTDEDDRVLRVELVTLRDGQDPSDPTHVYLHFPANGETRVVGIERE
jgi:hypothetical protein